MDYGLLTPNRNNTVYLRVRVRFKHDYLGNGCTSNCGGGWGLPVKCWVLYSAWIFGLHYCDFCAQSVQSVPGFAVAPTWSSVRDWFLCCNVEGIVLD